MTGISVNNKWFIKKKKLSYSVVLFLTYTAAKGEGRHPWSWSVKTHTLSKQKNIYGYYRCGWMSAELWHADRGHTLWWLQVVCASKTGG